MSYGGARRQVDLCSVVPDTLFWGKLACLMLTAWSAPSMWTRCSCVPVRQTPVARPPGELAGRWSGKEGQAVGTGRPGVRDLSQT